MADKLGLGPEPRELKIGDSFSSNELAFHTLRYDFKPASVVSASKHASIEVGANNQITVTHLESAGAPQTVFKGLQRPPHNECVLIIDRSTGEITLEKLSTNIQLKMTRQESHKPSNCGRPPTPVQKKPSPPGPRQRGGGRNVGGVAKHSPLHSSSSYPMRSHKPSDYGRPPMPVQKKPSPPGPRQRGGGRNVGGVAKHSPLQSSPSYPMRSPAPHPASIHKSPTQVHITASSPIPARSMPILDELNDNSSSSFDIAATLNLPEIKTSPDFSGISLNDDNLEDATTEVGIISDSSSSSSSDSNSSDSDSEPEPPRKPMNGHVNGKSSPSLASMPIMPESLLIEDLQLSESGSDSD